MMTHTEIIDQIKDATNNDLSAMLAVLCDGSVLLSLGITDDDTEAVECAYSIIKAWIGNPYRFLE